MDEQISDRQDGSAPAQRPSVSVGRASVPGLITSRADESLPQAKAATVYRAIPSGDEGDLAGDGDELIDRVPDDDDAREKPVGSVRIPAPRQGEPVPAEGWHGSVLADAPLSQPEPPADAWLPSSDEFVHSSSRVEAAASGGLPPAADLLPPGEPLPRRTARRDAAPWIDLATPDPIPGTPFSAFGPKIDPKPIEDQNPYRVRATARVPGLTPSAPPSPELSSPTPPSPELSSPAPPSPEPQRPEAQPIMPAADPFADRRPMPETDVPTALDPPPAAASPTALPIDSIADRRSSSDYAAPDYAATGSADGSAAVVESQQVRPPTYRGSAAPISRMPDAQPSWTPSEPSIAFTGPAEEPVSAKSAVYSADFAEPAEAIKPVESTDYSTEFGGQGEAATPAGSAVYSTEFAGQAEAAELVESAVYPTGSPSVESPDQVESVVPPVSSWSPGAPTTSESGSTVEPDGSAVPWADAVPADSSSPVDPFTSSWTASSSWAATAPAASELPPVEPDAFPEAAFPEAAVPEISLPGFAAPSESAVPSRWTDDAPVAPWADDAPAEPLTDNAPAELGIDDAPVEDVPSDSPASDEPSLRADRDLRELFGFGSGRGSDVEDDSFGAYWTPDEPRPDLDRELAKFGVPDQPREEPSATELADPGSRLDAPAFERGLAWRSLADAPADQVEPDPVVPPSIGKVRAAVRVPGLTIEPPPAGSATPVEVAAAPVAAETRAPAGRAPEIRTPEIKVPNAEPVPATIVSDDEDRPLAVPRAIEFDGEPAVKSTTAPPVQPPQPAPLVNYSVEDWRSNVRGSAVVNVEAAGTVYRGELGGPDEPEPVSTAQRVMRYAVVAILLALFVLAFLYGPKIDEWFSS